MLIPYLPFDRLVPNFDLGVLNLAVVEKRHVRKVAFVTLFALKVPSLGLKLRPPFSCNFIIRRSVLQSLDSVLLIELGCLALIYFRTALVVAALSW